MYNSSLCELKLIGNKTTNESLKETYVKTKNGRWYTYSDKKKIT